MVASKLTITKKDNNNFNINFSDPVNGPGDAKPGGDVPVQWMQAVLDYYQRNADPQKGLSAAHRKVLPW
jgi:hypothetical protein